MGKARSTKEGVISKFKSIHGDRYDYSCLEYVDGKTKVDIKCHFHGIFSQTVGNHNKGKGCPICAKAVRSNNRTKSTLEFKFKDLIQPKDYRLIPLSKGIFTKVDIDDFDRLKDASWSATSVGYAHNSKLGLLHRVIMNTPKGLYVDHINGDGLDNRKINLRICTQQENNMNQSIQRDKSSKFKGVCWAKNQNKWISYIGHNKRLLYLGYFHNEIEAAKAYDSKARDLFGEFAHTNF